MRVTSFVAVRVNRAATAARRGLHLLALERELGEAVVPRLARLGRHRLLALHLYQATLRRLELQLAARCALACNNEG